MQRLAWLTLLPALMAAKGGCGAYDSTDPAPDVSASWNLEYGSMMKVDVALGGSIYTQNLSEAGGAFTITHAGKAFEFDLDCSRADVICPSEVWPDTVKIDQREPMYAHRMWVTIPTQSCSGQLVAPDKSQCGEGTNNPECKPVCNGTLTTSSSEAFGLINQGGTSFDLLLGGTAATDGKNCALLGVSWAKAKLDTTRTGALWTAESMRDGEVKTAYAGGCLFAGDINNDGQAEALLVGATVSLSTPFSADRL